MTEDRVSQAALETAAEIAGEGGCLDDASALALAGVGQTERLMNVAGRLRDRVHGETITYSRKVFIPLTKLCRDVCHYCTFARQPRKGDAAYLSLDEVLRIARAGAAAGCTEALFTLGDKPELRYEAARNALEHSGHSTTLSYLAEAAERVLAETGLIPHLNPGIVSDADVAALRPVCASMGLMLESASPRLSERGGPHFGSPDKAPAARLAAIAAAGRACVPFTSGILIGIGETRRERIEALLALRRLQALHGHIQEVIVQNFRAKPGTPMAAAAEPSEDDLLWTIAVSRLVLGGEANIQAPPNLSPGALTRLIAAGINDWGGVSPVTPDHVNPERPWPHLKVLERQTARAGKRLLQRLPIYPSYALRPHRWLDKRVAHRVLNAIDAQGLTRTETWRAGSISEQPTSAPCSDKISGVFERIIDRAQGGYRLSANDIATLFGARGAAFHAVCAAADALRRRVAGDTVTYVVNRNINYTNICTYGCRFCAFSKGKTSDALRGRSYILDDDEIARRVEEAWARGATEVCMQGGIHPSYTGETYLRILRAAKAAVPEIHVHAFSPLEVLHGASTLGLPVKAFLQQLREAGLGSLPGTAAEILDDEVRAVLCPDKLSTREWLEVIRTAHEVGLRTTATIMFGHIDEPVHWGRHLDALRNLQEQTGGITEFVPLPFVAKEAPIYLKGLARPGPTYREAVLMHAVARLALHPVIRNVQTSWVKMGPNGAKACLEAGANDLGGTLMNESITRAAGAVHGQELSPSSMDAIIASIGRTSRVRTTTYGDVSRERVKIARDPPPLKSSGETVSQHALAHNVIGRVRAR